MDWWDEDLIEHPMPANPRRGKHVGPFDIDECSECVSCNILKATGRHASAWTETWENE